MADQLREALEKAYDKVEAKEAGGSSAGAAQSLGSSEQKSQQAPEQKPAGGKPAGEKPEHAAAGGESAPGSDQKIEAKPDNADKPDAGKAVERRQQADDGKSAGEEGDGAGKEDDRKPPEQKVSGRAPNSWKVEAREEWAKTPPKVQAEILRREREIETTLSNTRNTRQFAEEMRSTLEPYLPLITARGSTPAQAIKNLMGTAAGLTMGTHQQKAQIVVNIIREYGVDIKTLDEALSESAPKGGSENRAPAEDIGRIVEHHVNQRLAPLNRQMQERNQQTEQQLVQAIEDFAADPQNEFWNDVSDDVADIMDSHARRGSILTLPEAYKRACQINPEVSKILEQRRAAANSNGNNKNRAASTIRGGPAGGKPTLDLSDRRAVIGAAWDKLSA